MIIELIDSIQRLFSTKPKLSSNQACEIWGDLIMIMSWQLWLGRSECIDNPLPWQSTQKVRSPTFEPEWLSEEDELTYADL